MRECVVSLGLNSSGPSAAKRQNYSAGLRRISDDLTSFGFKGVYIAWDQRMPPGCPRHEDSPFGFKPFCINDAFGRGFRQVLWVDSSIRIRQPLDPLFKIIKEQGHLFFVEDHSIGHFCKDEALGPLGIGREESFSLPCCWACVIGLNLTNPVSLDFLEIWTERAKDGTFSGPKWGSASKDPRVMGHRHDQTAASAIALRLGMGNWKSKRFFSWFFENDRDYVRTYSE